MEMLIEEKLKNLERKVDKLKLLNYNYSYIYEGAKGGTEGRDAEGEGDEAGEDEGGKDICISFWKCCF